MGANRLIVCLALVAAAVALVVAGVAVVAGLGVALIVSGVLVGAASLLLVDVGGGNSS